MTATKKSPHTFLALALSLAAGLATIHAGAADTTLKDVMKKMNAQMLNGDAKPLAAHFEATKAQAKPEFPNWAAISDKGKAAAAAGNIDGAKATCKECHDAYRTAYKTKYGSKAP